MTVKTFSQQPILKLDGKVFKESYLDIEDGKEIANIRDLTVDNAIIAALQNPISGDNTLTFKQIFINMTLAEKIHKGGEILLESEDITNIKERVTIAWAQPVAVYRVIQFLEE